MMTPSVISPSTTPPTILAALPMCSTSNRFTLQKGLDDRNGALDRLRDRRAEPHRSLAVLMHGSGVGLAPDDVHALEAGAHRLRGGQHFLRIHRMRLDRAAVELRQVG